MAVVDLPGTFSLLIRVDAEQHINGFGPLSAIIGGVEQSHIELDMHAVIFGKFVDDGCNIVEGWGRGRHTKVQDRTPATLADR